ARFDASTSQSACAEFMQSANAAFDPVSSGSQHGGGELSQDGPNWPSSHSIWHSEMPSVQRRLERSTRSANFAPSRANPFWHFATSASSAYAGAASARTRGTRRNERGGFDMRRVIARVSRD